MVPVDLPYGFLLMVNSNIWPNTGLLRDISLENMSDLEFDLSRSLKVKSNGAGGLPVYDFLLAPNSNYGSNLHRLGVIATRKIFSYFLSLWPNFDTPRPTFTPVQFFQNRIVSFLCQREGLHQK